MKKTLLFAALIIMIASGCKKYPDGPAISLRSKTARVSNTWKVEQYLLNGVDKTSDFNVDKRNYIETYTKDGKWSRSYIDPNGDPKSDAGTWTFDSKKEIINRDSGPTDQLHILKLKEKEFWFWYTDNGDKKEFHLIPN